MKNVYEEIPVLENERWLLRGIEDGDAAALLAVYSDRKAQPFFNSDNCNDKFCYETAEQLKSALDFWKDAYKNGWFVRLCVVDKRRSAAVGTVELFRREPPDERDGTGLLRLDLSSGCERREEIKELLSLLIPTAYFLFDCRKILTKAVEADTGRREALAALGFVPAGAVENGGMTYNDYFLRRATFMDEAAVEAYKGVSAGEGGPFGSVVVKDGEIVGRGHNVVVRTKDPTAHGEVSAIRDACRRLGSYHLTGCELYTTAEPCPMCLGAILWAGIEKVWYGCTCADTSDLLHFADSEFYKVVSEGKNGFMECLERDACLQVFADYQRQKDKKAY